MHPHYRTQHYPRPNSFHGQKRQLLGNHAGQPAPAWKVSGPGGPLDGGVPKGKQVAHDKGSKILMSSLPVDVGVGEVEELFKMTVGPVKESFIIYNSQGRSKGMAIVMFQRAGDAEKARTRYDGKMIDGRRPIKVEMITDGIFTPKPAPPPPTAPTLFARLGGGKPTYHTNGHTPHAPAPPTQPRNANPHPRQFRAAPHPVAVPPRKFRQKKGPRRVNKQFAMWQQRESLDKDMLDKEMEEYRAARDDLEYE